MSVVSKRLLLCVAGLAVAAVGVVAAIALAGGSADRRDGLSPQKVAELAKIGVSPARYAEAERHADAYSAALKSEPPPDPTVVGPRLVREQYESQFSAWKAYYARHLGAAVIEHWSTQVFSETHAVVTLQLATAAKGIGATARWALNFALTRPLTEREQELANGPHGIEALDGEAKRLSSFPAPNGQASRPVRIFADEALSPGNHELIVSIFPAERYEPNLLVRHGSWDEALSRGQILARDAPAGLHKLAISPAARFYEQSLGNGRAGPVKSSSIYRLAHLFHSGPVYLLLGWRSGARKLDALLGRPVREVVILTQ